MILAMCCLTVALCSLALATIELVRVTGASGSETLTQVDGLTTQLNAADAPMDNVSHPIQIPTSGTRYSYWACVCLNCNVAPTTEINNMVVYSSGSNPFGTGIGMNVSAVAGVNGSTTTNYTQATGTPAVTGLEMGANYGHSISTPTNFFSYTQSSPLSLSGSFVTGVDSAGSVPTGRFCDWLIEQLTVASTAASGITASATVTFMWDEF